MKPEDATTNWEEREVRQLLAFTASGASPTNSERDRVAAVMWAALDRPVARSESTPMLAVVSHDESDRVDYQRRKRDHPATRVLLWAAMLLIVVGTVSLIRTSVGQTLEPAAPIETSRTTLRVGETEMSFDNASGYDVETTGPAAITLVADQANLRTHERITIAQAEQLFDGENPDDFLSGRGMQAERVDSPDGSTAWLVSVGTTSQCELGEPCVAIATILGGEPLKLLAGTYARIEVYDNKDGGPVVVVSEVGSRTNGPALLNVELTD